MHQGQGTCGSELTVARFHDASLQVTVSRGRDFPMSSLENYLFSQCVAVFFFSKIYFLYEYTIAVFMDTPEEDPIINGGEAPSGFWELNLGPLEKQSILLSAEPSLQCVVVF